MTRPWQQSVSRHRLDAVYTSRHSQSIQFPWLPCLLVFECRIKQINVGFGSFFKGWDTSLDPLFHPFGSNTHCVSWVHSLLKGDTCFTCCLSCQCKGNVPVGPKRQFPLLTCVAVPELPATIALRCHQHVKAITNIQPSWALECLDGHDSFCFRQAFQIRQVHLRKNT
jgi:hypothetical protein